MSLTTRSRVAILTGASRGIGPFIADALAQRGFSLVLAARNTEQLEEVAGRIRKKFGVDCLAVSTDVSDLLALDHLMATTMATHGRIDVLINNAAVERMQDFTTTPFEWIENDLAVNVRAVMYLSQQCLKVMEKQKEGCLINIASLAGLGGYAHGEAYVATKHAVVGFTRALRASLYAKQSPIRASCICPGYVANVGMFHRKVESHALSAPIIMGSSTPQAVAKAVVKCLKDSPPEVIVNPRPIRPFLAIVALFPRIGESLRRFFGIDRVSETASKPSPLDD